MLNLQVMKGGFKISGLISTGLIAIFLVSLVSLETIAQTSTSEYRIAQPSIISMRGEPMLRNDREERVRLLQIFLNRIGHTVATEGPGSQGQETEYFGVATERALKDFQIYRGLEPTGVLDRKTQTMIDQDNIEREIRISRLKIQADGEEINTTEQEVMEQEELLQLQAEVESIVQMLGKLTAI